MACFILGPVVWADDGKPSVPVPIPAGDDNLLPPVDLSSFTPLPQPATNKPTPVPTPAKNSRQAATPTASTSSPQAVKAAAEVSPAPEAPMAESTESVSTSSPQAAAAETTNPGAAVSAGTLTDYFPVVEGALRTYEYTQPASGQAASFTVKCASVKTMPNGTIRIVQETTEGGQSIRDRYSLYDNKVEHKATGDQAFTGDFAFKLPKPGEEAFWSVTEKNGTIHKSKAVFGQSQLDPKTYPDCVVVTEKVIKEGQTVNTVIYDYAKGKGLVSMEVYSPNMKLSQDKSYSLAPAGEGAAP